MCRSTKPLVVRLNIVYARDGVANHFYSRCRTIHLNAGAIRRRRARPVQTEHSSGIVKKHLRSSPLAVGAVPCNMRGRDMAKWDKSPINVGLTLPAVQNELRRLSRLAAAQ